MLYFSQFLGTVVSLFFLPDSSEAQRLLIVVFMAVIVLGVVLLLARQWLGLPLATFKLQKPGKGWIKKLIISAVVYVCVSLALLVLVALLVPSFNSNQPQDVGLQNPHGTWQLVFGFISLVVLTPIYEETIFRGMLFTGLRRNASFAFSAVLSATVFAFLHGQWNVAIDTFALGLTLAYLVEKTNSVVPGMVLHATKNLVAFIFLFVLAK